MVYLIKAMYNLFALINYKCFYLNYFKNTIIILQQNYFPEITFRKVQTLALNIINFNFFLKHKSLISALNYNKHLMLHFYKLLNIFISLAYYYVFK